MVWSHRADLGGVGKTRAMHGPHNMVALGLQDLWAAGVGPKWALRLPGQRTQGWGAGQTTSLQITKEGGDSAKRRVTGDRSQIITARRTARKGEADEGAYEESAASGAAALRMIGSTDGYGQERDDGRGAAEGAMGEKQQRK
jgi:hypothetical protein